VQRNVSKGDFLKKKCFRQRRHTGRGKEKGGLGLVKGNKVAGSGRGIFVKNGS
jgi:hypothetical protein